MKKRIIILICVLSVSIFSANAQTSDQLTLKNGSIIRGSIVEIIPESKVSINDAAGNTWVYEMSEVEQIKRIEMGDIPKGESKTNFYEGFANQTSIGFLAGSNNSMQVAPFSLITSFGYKNKLGMYTGLATGLEFLNVNHIPLMADFQYFVNSSDVSPVFILRGGYSLPSVSDNEFFNYKGGFAGAIGVGLKIRSRENFAWDVNILYRYMNINYTQFYDWNEQDYHYTDVYNRLELRVGFYLD